MFLTCSETKNRGCYIVCDILGLVYSTLAGAVRITGAAIGSTATLTTREVATTGKLSHIHTLTDDKGETHQHANAVGNNRNSVRGRRGIGETTDGLTSR